MTIYSLGTLIKLGQEATSGAQKWVYTKTHKIA